MDIDAVVVKIECVCTRLEDALAELQQLAVKKPAPYAKVRETHPNAGKAWSAADDEELRRLFTAGNGIDDLALLFGRTPKGVRLRLERLALISPAAA
ncbi:MAG TPA: hypothetical protein VGZ02_13910 [Candidatus Baltobacteraceae bacterium]|jgi:hypothetical protein|nr:hypothetical protein [Candidatus Baltobacteraceae bacterium]